MDAEDTWTFQDKFDFIHVRCLAAAIRDWSKLVRQAFDATQPGGYAEYQDFDLSIYSLDGSLISDLEVAEWISTLRDASCSFNRDPCPGPELEGWLKDAGYQDVHHEKFILPIGDWPQYPHLVMSMSIQPSPIVRQHV